MSEDNRARLRAEFTIEPFQIGDRGEHGKAALSALERRGLTYDDGPFGTVIEGSDTAVVGAVGAVVEAAMSAGATRVSIQVVRPSG